MKNILKIRYCIILISILTLNSCDVSNKTESYKVIYNGNSNTSGTVPVDNNSYTTGSLVTIKENTGELNREGYDFGGWSLEQNSNETLCEEQLEINTSDITLYAYWDEINYSDTVVMDSNPYYHPSTATLGETVSIIIPMDNYDSARNVYAYPTSFSGDSITTVDMEYDFKLKVFTGKFTIEEYYPESIGITQINFYNSDHSSRTAFFEDDYSVIPLEVTGTTPDTTGPSLQSITFSPNTAVIGDTVTLQVDVLDMETGIKPNYTTQATIINDSEFWSETIWGKLNSDTGYWESDIEITSDFPSSITLDYLIVVNGVGVKSSLRSTEDFTSPVLTIDH